MAIRRFTDRDGVVWEVWNVIPAAANLVRPDLADGWLSFKSREEHRRLAPIPANWHEASSERLGLMCRAASVVAEVSAHVDGAPDDSGRPS